MPSRVEWDPDPAQAGTGTLLAPTDPSETNAGVLNMLNIDILNRFGQFDIDRRSYAELQREVGKREELIESFANDFSLQDKDLFEDEFLLH